MKSSGEGVALFDLKTPEGRARCCILGSECLKAVYTALTTGVFLTGFLLGAGMNEVQIGAVTSLPLLAGVLYPFSSLLLERFRKRKVVLLLGNAANILVASGFPAWHIGFLPEEIRGRFFAISGIINSVCTACTSFGASLLADAAGDSGRQLYWMGVIRLAAYGLAILELVLLLLPGEPVYPVSRVRGRRLLLLPFGNRKFCLTMIPVFAWMMISTMTLYSANTYLLKEVQVNYTFISLLQAMNILVTAVTMPFWHRLLLRTSWLSAFQKVFLLFPIYPFLHMLVTKQTQAFLLPAAMLVYQAVIAGGTLYFNNMAYLFTPKENRTAYLSWYLMLVNLGSLCGQGLSALLLQIWKHTWQLGGIKIVPTQRILLLQGLLSMGFALWFDRVLLHKIERKEAG